MTKDIKQLMKAVYITLLALMLFASGAQATSIYIPPTTLSCTFSEEIYRNTPGLIQNKTVIINSIYGLYDIKNVCLEQMPDDVIEKIEETRRTGECKIAAPGRQETGLEYTELSNGWSYWCTPQPSPLDAGLNTVSEFFVFSAFYFIFIFTAIFAPWFILLIFAIYGAITYYKKLKIVNEYLFPVFFGLIGSLAASLKWKHEWKSLFAVGILNSLVLYFAVKIIFLF